MKHAQALLYTPPSEFQLLLKGCTIEAALDIKKYFDEEFQLLLKGCTIEASRTFRSPGDKMVSVVVERMYD